MQTVIDLEINRYEADIRKWDWAGLKADALRNPTEDIDGRGDVYYQTFLGTVFAIMPSGKYYMLWACSNVSEEEASADEEFMEALEKVAEEHGMWVESGEGDPCDMFLCCQCDAP